MAQFNIDSHLSDGKSLQWLALPDAGEQPLDVEVKVRQAAMKKFGQSVFFNVSVWPTHLPDPSCSRHGVHLFLVDT
ncbi:hypothetical protein, partial [Pseudomonas aeruginosa]|uniref:hypothetical protein n=1 Tax=Pseudomonas aeruginosa TaxID=287 RepID=UPI00396F414B